MSVGVGCPVRYSNSGKRWSGGWPADAICAKRMAASAAGIWKRIGPRLLEEGSCVPVCRLRLGADARQAASGKRGLFQRQFFLDHLPVADEAQRQRPLIRQLAQHL